MNNTALTYDDITLIPEFSDIKSRRDVSLRTLVSKRYGIMLPVIASPMDTVCELEMAWRMFKLGGVGVIHRFMTSTEQIDMVRELYDRIYKTDDGMSTLEDWGVMFGDWHSEIPYPPIIAAIGVRESDKQRAKNLVEAGANVLVIDVAHGHHKNVIDMIKWCKSNLKDTVDIIAGNIATKEAVEDLENTGVDGLRVNVGAGSICSTRIQTGFGVPSVTSIIDVVSVATVPVIADGGIRSSGDISKALALGANSVMLGSLIAGTDEAPGHIIETNDGLYKRYRGSASLEAKQDNGGKTNNIEGESTMIPYKGGVKFVINKLQDGLRSALSYGGARNLSEYTPKYVTITPSGIIESHPHLIK